MKLSIHPDAHSDGPVIKTTDETTWDLVTIENEGRSDVRSWTTKPSDAAVKRALLTHLKDDPDATFELVETRVVTSRRTYWFEFPRPRKSGRSSPTSRKPPPIRSTHRRERPKT